METGIFPGGSDGKESACSVEDPGLIPGLGRSSGERNGNPLQYSCLENPTDRGHGNLQSMGPQRVRHYPANSLSLFSWGLLPQFRDDITETEKLSNFSKIAQLIINAAGV